jgi:beta-glucanase (GH16 family)
MNILNEIDFYTFGSHPKTDLEHSGNSPKNGIFNFQPQMVDWKLDGSVVFNVKKEISTGYFRGEGDWIFRPRQREYMAGGIITYDTFGFGHYTLVCSFPSFRGSWEAFWAVDWKPRSEGGMGMPPEFDIFERFLRKCWDRHKLVPGFIYGSDYEAGKKEISKPQWRWKSWNKGIHQIEFIWKPDLMQYIYDGKVVLEITDRSIIPQGAVNWYLNSGLGDWRPDEKHFDSFTVYELDYEPFKIETI